MPVNTLRRLVSRNPCVVACLLAAVLIVKLLVPGGYMPVVADGRIMVQVCTGMMPAATPMTMAADMPDMTHHDTDGSDEHGKAQMPCAFAGFGLASIDAVDVDVLAAAIAFALARGFAAISYRPHGAPAYLRPPLRGPPVAA